MTGRLWWKMTSRRDLAGDGIKLSRCFHHSSLATTGRYLAVSTNQQRGSSQPPPSERPR